MPEPKQTRYRAYPAYKPSGLDWLGKIPAHWKTARIGKHFKERREKVSDKDFQALSVTMQGIVPQLETAAKSDDSDNRRLVRQGDFVINSRSDRKGSSGVSALDGSVSLICTVIHSRDFEPAFMHHLFRSYPFQEEFYRFGKGIVADLWSTNFNSMKNITIPVFSKLEQTQIAAFLDYETAKIDALIAKQQRLIALLEEKRQAVISHAVTKGLNPDAPMRPSGIDWLGDVPAHWEVKRIKHIADIQSGIPKGPSGEARSQISVPMLRVANVQDGYLDLSSVHEIKILPSQLDRFRLRIGDVLMNEGGDNDKLGRGAIWEGQIDPCIHQNHVFAIRTKFEDSEWLSVVTRASYAKFSFYRVAKQSTNLASISSTNIKEVPIVLPPPKERSKILEFISEQKMTFDGLHEKCLRQVTLLKERRTALISAAVTGRIDVRGWTPPDIKDTAA